MRFSLFDASDQILFFASFLLRLSLIPSEAKIEQIGQKPEWGSQFRWRKKTTRPDKFLTTASNNILEVVNYLSAVLQATKVTREKHQGKIHKIS